MSDYKEITLEGLNNGQLGALFDRELAKVLENIADQNTSATATRTIVITVKMRPEDESREAVKIEVTGASKLAPVSPSRAYAVLSFDGERVRAYQNDPKQALLEEIAVAEARANGGEVKNVDFTGKKPVIAGGR